MIGLQIYCPDCDHEPEHHTASGCMCTGDENRPCRCDYSLDDIVEIYNPTSHYETEED